MQLTFFEVIGDPLRDGRVTAMRQGEALMPLAEDTTIEGSARDTSLCFINDVPFEVSAFGEDRQVFYGTVNPYSRHQRHIRFGLLRPREHDTTAHRIVLLEGSVARGEVIDDIEPARTIARSGQEGMICYTPGTRVLTAFGDIPIEMLNPGDMVHTVDSGLQPIRWIGKRDISATRQSISEAVRPVLVKKGALGPNLPNRDLMVSPSHRFLIDHYRSEALFDEKEVLAPALGLINDLNIIQPDTPRDTVYMNLLFDEHQLIFAEGAVSESFMPCPKSILSLSADDRDEVFDIFPHLAAHPLSYGSSARATLEVHEAQVLAAA